jgi:DNA primase
MKPKPPIALRPFGVLYRIESGQWEVEWQQTEEQARKVAEDVAREFPNTIVQVVERKAAVEIAPLMPVWSRA